MTDAGLRRFLDDLHDLEAAVEDTDDPDRRASELLADQARSRARKVSGYMADSVHPTDHGIEADAVYAPIVHEGWRGITPNPFMTETADQADEIAGPVYLDHLEHQLHNQIRSTY